MVPFPIEAARDRQADLLATADRGRCCGRDELLRQRRRAFLRSVLRR